MEIYAYARKFMAEHGNPNQWGPTNWPPEWLIKEDIEKGCSYVCESDNGSSTYGFVHRGTIHVDEDDNPRMAFEKISQSDN